jgi:hypothetical protein
VVELVVVQAAATHQFSALAVASVGNNGMPGTGAFVLPCVGKTRNGVTQGRDDGAGFTRDQLPGCVLARAQAESAAPCGWLDERAETQRIGSVLTEIESFRAPAR